MVEVAAMRAVKAAYKNKRWAVRDVSKDNKGWDIEVALAGAQACLEVKGLSGTAVAVEVTPNEYKQMKRAERGQFDQGLYRLCVVTSALNRPTLHEFEFYPRAGAWVDMRTGRVLDKQEVMSAAFRESAPGRSRSRGAKQTMP